MTGIGRATARRLVAEGAIVTVTDVNEKAGQAVVEELGPNAMFVQTYCTIMPEFWLPSRNNS